MGFDTVFGDMALETEMRGNGVKGNLMAKRAWYVREFFGGAAFDAVVAKLDGEAREYMLNPPLTMSWCSFGAMMDIDRAILDGPMKGDFAKMKHFGGEIAKHDLPTLYKVLFKVGSPAFVMRRMNIAAIQYIKDTSITPETPTDKSAKLTLGKRPWPLYFCTYGAPGWYSIAAELSGGKNVTVTHTACRHKGADTCRWAIAWS
jgi:hypothetical protein